MFLELEEIMQGYDAVTGWKGRYIYLFVFAIVVVPLSGDLIFENPTRRELKFELHRPGVSKDLSALSQTIFLG